jgi:hypothetical protein
VWSQNYSSSMKGECTLSGLAPGRSTFSGVSSEAESFRLPEVSKGGGTSSTFSSVDSFTSQNPNSFTLPAERKIQPSHPLNNQLASHQHSAPILKSRTTVLAVSYSADL